jgi:hypothetical protein
MYEIGFLTPRNQQELRETVELFLNMKGVAITEEKLTRLCQRGGNFEHEITAGTIVAVMQDFRREIAEHKRKYPHLYLPK